MTARVVGSAHEAQYTVPSGGLTSGQLVQFNGFTWIYQGLQNALEGDVVTLRRELLVSVPKDAAATTFALGASAGYDISALAATTAADEDADFVIYGKVRKASTSSDTHVLIALGETDTDT